jgi:hypothetical protein
LGHLTRQQPRQQPRQHGRSAAKRSGHQQRSTNDRRINHATAQRRRGFASASNGLRKTLPTSTDDESFSNSSSHDSDEDGGIDALLAHIEGL